MKTWKLGGPAEFFASFTDDQGDPFDPDSVTLTLRAPAGAEFSVDGVEVTGFGQRRAETILDPSGGTGEWVAIWTATVGGEEVTGEEIFGVSSETGPLTMTAPLASAPSGAGIHIVIKDPPLVWTGEWHPDHPYRRNEVAGWEGQSWVATQENQGVTPSELSEEWSLIAAKGEEGPEGPQGPEGPRGPGGFGGTLKINQDSPSSEWVLDHGLEAYPSVTVVDSGGSQVFGAVEYVNDQTVIIRFSSAFAGVAFFN